MSPVILPVPHVQQHQRGECLAACAAMVLAYLGVSVAYGRLLKLLRVKTQIGAPASNIRNLKKLGLDVIYQQGTLAKLHNHLTSHRPCIAFVKTSELPYWAEQTNHAIVLTGLDDDYVYLNDPAFANAPIQISHDDFGLAWLEWDELYATFILQ